MVDAQHYTKLHHSMGSSCPGKLDKAMSAEQFTQVVDAILEGKYSWACVLILRFAGYNPLHYIPYRTYNRLMKENCQTDRAKGNSGQTTHREPSTVHGAPLSDSGSPTRIRDLNYLELVEQPTQVKGGRMRQWLQSTFCSKLVGISKNIKQN